MIQRIILFLLSTFPLLLSAQHRHHDFIGAGHANEVTVTASSGNSIAERTIDGFDIQEREQLKQASRFLAQATLGADFATIQMTAAMGYEAWLDEQFALPTISYLEKMFEMNEAYAEEPDDLEYVSAYLFSPTWINLNVTNPATLRARSTFILSQIFPINYRTDLFEDVGQVVGGYYDVLNRNSFGQYEQLLLDVTLSPAMGHFLTHWRNPKADPANNIHPDENYAREVMQLFSIGLWELHPNGLRKYDSNGQNIPTYTNADIKEFAQVFTGLSDGSPGGFFDYIDGEIGEALTTPMNMYDEWHDQSEKVLLNGVVLPANQDGMTDVEQTINHLSNHPNTAPFISKSLIRFMTTSNPSPVYVEDVAAVFNPSEPNNFQEVIRAILLHPEARTCQPTPQYTFGKLREPLQQYMNITKAFQLMNDEEGFFFSALECWDNSTSQVPLNPPSVFNFFLPEYSPQGPINQNYYVAPEFQLMNASNAIGLVNELDFKAARGVPLEELCEDEDDDYLDDEFILDSEYDPDYSALFERADNPADLVDYLDILLANGGLSTDTKDIIINAVGQLDDEELRIRMAMFLVMVSPDYTILK